MELARGLTPILRDAARSDAAPQDEVGDIFTNLNDELEIFTTCLK
jgi:hypothetical protein